MNSSSSTKPAPSTQPTAKGAKVIALIRDLLLHTPINQTAVNLLATELAADAETADGATLFGTVLEMERLAQAQCKTQPQSPRCERLLTPPG
jgi:hypothetical protein